jgi:hypothetical protein
MRARTPITLANHSSTHAYARTEIRRAPLLAHTSSGTEVELGGTQREWNRDLVMVAGEEVSPAQMWVVPCAESPTHSAELGVLGIAWHET